MNQGENPYLRAVTEMVTLGREAGLGEQDLRHGEKRGTRFFVAQHQEVWWHLIFFWMCRPRILVQLVPEANLCEVHDARWERIATRALAAQKISVFVVRVYLH